MKREPQPKRAAPRTSQTEQRRFWRVFQQVRPPVPARPRFTI
jgi:hypothetical protein